MVEAAADLEPKEHSWACWLRWGAAESEVDWAPGEALAGLAVAAEACSMTDHSSPEADCRCFRSLANSSRRQVRNHQIRNLTTSAGCRTMSVRIKERISQFHLLSWVSYAESFSALY